MMMTGAAAGAAGAPGVVAGWLSAGKVKVPLLMITVPCVWLLAGRPPATQMTVRTRVVLDVFVSEEYGHLTPR